jgi:hypothetical protein
VQVWTAKAGKLASMHEYVDTRAVNAAYLPHNGCSTEQDKLC